MCADRPEGGPDQVPEKSDQKEGGQDQDQGTETLGQRLLQEPIWIGLIVILSVVFLSIVSYLIRRKWGRKFNCCDIKKPKEDDNIINADGTITLNSFPLKRITRPPTLSPISISPSHPSYTLSETPTPNPSTNNHSAAARFFASYKDAERSPISTTVTTDFIQACDTSLSHDLGDSSVGAIVGGRLLLNLHAKEHQHQEAMTRAQSLMNASTRTTGRDKIKRSHSLGPFGKGKSAQTKENSSGSSVEQYARSMEIFSLQAPKSRSEIGKRDRSIQNINDMDHIYPNVIVHAPQNPHSDDDDADDETIDANGENCRAYSHQYASNQPHSYEGPREPRADRSGARIIQVNIEGGSSGSGEGSAEPRVSPAHHSPRLSLNHVSRSVDSVLAHLPQNSMRDFTADYEESMKKDKLHLYSQMLEEWKNRARQKYRLAKLAAQKEKNELYEQRLREKSGYHGFRMRMSACQRHRRLDSAPHPLRRTKTVDMDHSGCANDISTRRARFSGKQGRQFTSMEDLESQHQKFNRIHHRNRMHETGELPYFTDCDCPECMFNISTSFNSDVSSLGRSALTSQDWPVYSSASYKSERPRADHVKYSSRSVSTTSDPLRRHSHRSMRRAGSFHRRDSIKSSKGNKYRQRRSRHGSGSTKTTRTLRVNNALSSSTDSEFNWRVIQSKLPMNSSRDKFAPIGVAQVKLTAPGLTISEVEPNIVKPNIHVTEPVMPKTDVFHTFFSQVVESDDLNSAGEEDDAYILQSRPSAKQNILNSIPVSKTWSSMEDPKLQEIFDLTKQTPSPAGKGYSGIVRELLPNQPDEFTEPEAETTSKFCNRRNTIVTVKTTGSLEGTAYKTSSMGSSSSRDKSDNSCGTPTTCNVIVYDSSASFDTSGTLPAVKTKFILTKKHSSLDLSNPHRLQPSQAALRNAASMQELTKQAECAPKSSCSYNNISHCFEKASSLISMDVVTASPPLALDATVGDSQTPKMGTNLLPDTSQTSEVFIVEPDQGRSKSCNRHTNTTSYPNSHSSSKEEAVFVPKTPTSSVDEAFARSASKPDGTIYLSVVDTDPSSGSAHSSQTTPKSQHPNKTVEQKTKDSAYQTKQSSVDVEAALEPRIRRYPQAPKEEERRVTQRLHQAAVKLLVMQQRLRRARQHLSKDSAVHTISEDDPSLDDIIIVSPKTRTFKPGVLYPAPALRDGETLIDFPPTIYGRIVEEQDPSVEYEV